MRCCIMLLLWCGVLLSGAPHIHAIERQVLVVPITGVIGPASSQLLQSGLQEAETERFEAVVLTIDTPGGLDTSMREMVKAILASDTPIICYVTPQGARAASAGTYLLYACPIAAMAPATNLGAATPVSMSPSSDEEPSQDQADKSAPSNQQSMRNKVVNDAVAYIRGLAELRGRNGDWAEQAVREGSSLSANEAESLGVVDMVAKDLPTLLGAIDGREVSGITIETASANVIVKETGWRHALLQAITNPNVALILMMIGFYGLILEFYSPGVGLPAVLGGICLLLGLYALNLLPINIAGAALMLLGVGLMVAEAFVPSFGLFAVGGVIAFSFGATLLMDTDLPELQIAFPLIAAVAIVSAGFAILMLRMALKSRSQAVVSGIQTLVGQRVALDGRYRQQGVVEIGGELWRARSREPIRGEFARIVAVDGLTLVLVAEEAVDD